MELTAQLLGFAGMTLNLISFQLRRQKDLIRVQFFSSIVFCLHYLLLGAVTGCVLNLVGICRAYVYSNKEKPWANHKYWLYLFIGAYFAVYVLTFAVLGKEVTAYNLLIELLPVIGMTCSTIGFYLESAAKVRRLSLMNAPTWLTYNIFNRSIGGALTEIFCLISVVVGIIRLDIKRAGKK